MQERRKKNVQIFIFSPKNFTVGSLHINLHDYLSFQMLELSTFNRDHFKQLMPQWNDQS